MITPSHNLIGPAAKVLATLKVLITQREKIAILLDGNPGCGKSHLSDALALELTKSKFAIETVNGQSLKVDLVRDWRQRQAYGNLFSDWTVKRIDELDQSHPSAQRTTRPHKECRRYVFAYALAVPGEIHRSRQPATGGHD